MEAKLRSDISGLKLLDIKLSDKEVLNNTKQILFTIYNIIKKGKPTESLYLFNDIFTVIESEHSNKNYALFRLVSLDGFSHDLIKLLLSYKHDYLKVFNLTHIDNNELILSNENKRKFYDLIRIIS